MLSGAVLTADAGEWMAAREIQRGFTRVGAASDWVDYSAHCRQVKELGGDFHDFITLAKDRVAMALGDASGKGLPAALMISYVQSAVRTAASFTGNDVRAAIAAVNRQVYGSSPADRYATLFYCVLERATGVLRYVNAGHHPALVVRRDGSMEWLETGGAPVGMFAEWPYEEGVVRLRAGDTVVAYTDGVIEAEDEAGEQWGAESLRGAVERSGAWTAGGVVRAIFEAVDEFARGGESDDATVAAMRVE